MSDSESFYLQTTYSEDQRIEAHLKAMREDEKQYRSHFKEYRKKLFHQMYTQKTKLIFSFRGLYFLYFTHRKIKFYFRPADTVKYVNKNLKFYCKLVYYEKYEWWYIKMDSFPVNYKKQIYSKFYGYSETGDKEIIGVITMIYKTLLIWAKNEDLYRREKFKRYKRGEIEDFNLDSNDLDLFFDENKKQELRAKRSAILKRMLLPNKKGNFEELERKLLTSSPSTDSE